MDFAQKELGPDSEMSRRQREFVSTLSAENIACIDLAILNLVSSRWRKFSYIVMGVMRELGGDLTELPDLYVAERLRILEGNPKFETRGYTRNMRYAEIRKAPSYDP